MAGTEVVTPDPYSPEPANDAASADGLVEVLALTAALADQVRSARIEGRPVPEDQIVALAKASRLLRERGVEVPPSLALVLREAGDDFGEVEPDADPPAAEDPAAAAKVRMARLLASLRFGTSP